MHPRPPVTIGSTTPIYRLVNMGHGAPFTCRGPITLATASLLPAMILLDVLATATTTRPASLSTPVNSNLLASTKSYGVF